MTSIIATKSWRGVSVGLAVASLLVLGASTMPAGAQERHDDRRGWDRHDERGHDRHWDHGDRDWDRDYRRPPVVYGEPTYYPPPVIYGPSVGVFLPGVSIGVR